MSASQLEPRSMQERAVDVMLFLLGQSSSPTTRDWYDAVDDLFGEFTESQKQRVVEQGIVLLERTLSRQPTLQLIAA